VVFAQHIPLEDFWDLHESIESLDDSSMVKKFAYGRMSLPRDINSTMVRVREGWHQEAEPHFTVQLWAEFDDP
jgi:hypothetical protein